MGASAGGGSVLTKMPYDGGSNRGWLHEHLGHRIQPEHRGKGVWAIARPHLRYLVEGLAERFGHVDVVLDFRQSERCDTRCQRARGDECTCSCLGENHRGAAYWPVRSFQTKTTPGIMIADVLPAV